MRKLSCVVLFAFLSSFLHANAADIDIRAASPLRTYANNTSFVVSVSHCDELAEATFNVAGVRKKLKKSDFLSDSANASICTAQIDVPLQGEMNAQLELKSISGQVQTHQEFFKIDSNRPEITFNKSEFFSSGERPFVRVEFEAADDIDISAVSISVLGLTASSIRNNGGVIERARASAFANSNGYITVPRADKP